MREILGWLSAGQTRRQPQSPNFADADAPRLKALAVRMLLRARTLIHRLESRPARRLRVSETLSLGEKRQLLLVECGERQLLIGAAVNFLATLAELRPAADTKTDAQEESKGSGAAEHE